jgi:cytochrome c
VGETQDRERMDSFEFNKIAGAVLSALLFIFGARELTHILGGHGGHGDHEAHAGYVLPMPKGGPAHQGGGAPAESGFSYAKVAELLPKASADSGKDVFRACQQCHTGEKGGPNKLGPNLYGVVGRDIGKHASFANYSSAMKDHGGKWTWEHLATYLHDPKSYVPGNRMSFAGVKDPNELADLLAYLRTLSDSPMPFPAAPATPAATPAAATKGDAGAKSEPAAKQGEAPAGTPAPAEKK